MKTVTKNISLSEDLARFANDEVEQGGYGSVSAYFADLLRQRRQKQIDADVKYITDLMRDAPAGPEPVDKIVETVRKVRRQMHKEKWGQK